MRVGTTYTSNRSHLRHPSPKDTGYISEPMGPKKIVTEKIVDLGGIEGNLRNVDRLSLPFVLFRLDLYLKSVS